MENKIAQFLKSFSKNHPLASRVVHQIQIKGGRALVVGGFVRDLLLDLPSKDLDIEVYGVELRQLEGILRSFGYVKQVGKAFGVLRLEGLDVDWSLPRFDAAGRRPKVELNPHLNYQEAFQRRDLTINALGVDLKTGDLIDPYDGVSDLRNKVLRYVDRNFFVEDPLRFYRVMQFIGRFEMVPTLELNSLCQTMSIAAVSKERIEQEFVKLFLKSRRPGAGIRWLQKIERLQEVLPELHATIGVPQNPIWHPEGDVFEHSIQALDVAALNPNYASTDEKLLVMWAALCHDLGKAVTTEMVDGRWRSLGHAAAGVPLAKSMLRQIVGNKELIAAIGKLIYHHMDLYQLTTNQVGAAAYKRLATKLYPQTLAVLAKVSAADRLGRQPQGHLPAQADLDQPSELQIFERQAKAAGVWEQVELPVLQGKDLLDVVEPGPLLGQLLQAAYQIQLEKGISDKAILRKLVIGRRRNF